MSKPRPDSNAPFAQPGSHRRALRTALLKRDLREAWWTVLDAWETRRAFRWGIYTTTTAIILGSVFWFVFLPRWNERNALRMARQWIEAGKPDYAAEAVLKSLQHNPRQPDLWLLAAELALMNRQRDLAVDYARRAADLRPGESKYPLALASTALQAGKPELASETLASLPAGERDRSSLAQRLLGELSRKANDLPAAAACFENALKLDGPGPLNEVPLGLCLLSENDPKPRERGRELLSRWIADREWGAEALRVLLDDSVRHNDLPSMARFAAALRAHPLCTYGDVPKCLQALSIADSNKFDEELARMEKTHMASPELASQLVGWLNQIGQSSRALAWIATLPPDALTRAPLAQAKAESLRCSAEWTALRDFAATGDWGSDVDFLRWCYGILAARKLGDENRSTELWSTLYNHALSNSAHAHFAGSLFYSWDLVKEAEALWWRSANGNSGVAYESLGSLARHYQVQRDADGQYKVFDRLHSLRPQDDDVTNNFVFFSVLTGNRLSTAMQLAQDLAQRHHNHPTYTATYAYALLSAGREQDAYRTIAPLAARFPKSSAVQFAYGLALAATGKVEKARPILEGLPPATLTIRETEIIADYLRR